MQKLRGFDPDLLQTLKREIVGCSVSCNIDTVMFTHQPTFLLNLIKLTRQTHKALDSEALLIQVCAPLNIVLKILKCNQRLCAPPDLCWADISDLCVCSCVCIFPLQFFCSSDRLSHHKPLLCVFALIGHWSSCTLLKQQIVIRQWYDGSVEVVTGGWCAEMDS